MSSLLQLRALAAAKSAPARGLLGLARPGAFVRSSGVCGGVQTRLASSSAAPSSSEDASSGGARSSRRSYLLPTAVVLTGAAAAVYMLSPAPLRLDARKDKDWVYPYDLDRVPTKPRLVILGSGWGATSLIKKLDTNKYEVTVVSPNNYFLFTPLLPSATVGTVELRSLIEPIRKLIKHLGGRFIECEATDVDFDNNKVILQDDKGNATQLPYDKLVIAVGSRPSTMGVSGVEHCHQLKTLQDATALRHKVMDNFERASLPTTGAEERQRLLSFVVCGGGPSGVEFAAELYDFLTEDLVNYFPELPLHEVRVSIIQSQDHILNMYDRKISEFAEEHLKKTNIDVLTRSRVVRVEPDRVVIKRKDEQGKLMDDEAALPFGLCLWSTGIDVSPLVKKVKEHLGVAQVKGRSLSTDDQLRLHGVKHSNVYAIGDCASIVNPQLVDNIADFFREADVDGNGQLSRGEFAQLAETLSKRFPQTSEHLIKVGELFDTYDKDHSGTLDLEELRVLLKSVDRNLTSLPATAQVASQQGKYLAAKLSGTAGSAVLESEKKRFVFPEAIEEKQKPFAYSHLGSLVYIGGAAGADFGSGRVVTGGWASKQLWRSAYWNEQVSLRTRALLAMDWTKEAIFGRDISRA